MPIPGPLRGLSGVFRAGTGSRSSGALNGRHGPDEHVPKLGTQKGGHSVSLFSQSGNSGVFRLAGKNASFRCLLAPYVTTGYHTYMAASRIPGRESSTDEKVVYIMELMARDEWDRAVCRKLADKWGVGARQVRNHSAEASRRLTSGLTDEQLRGRFEWRLEQEADGEKRLAALGIEMKYRGWDNHDRKTLVELRGQVSTNPAEMAVQLLTMPQIRHWVIAELVRNYPSEIPLLTDGQLYDAPQLTEGDE